MRLIMIGVCGNYRICTCFQRARGLKFGLKVKKKVMIRIPYNQIPHLTLDTIWKSDKNTRKQHTKESQEFSLLQKQAITRLQETDKTV